jgi:ATP-dependent DNA helicase PIF1
VVNFVFPHDVMADPQKCMQRAILSPFNAHVDEFNHNILARIPGDPRAYYSTDSIEDDDERSVNMVDNPLATPDFLNAQCEPGNPPHELNLKVGAICRFLRNFSHKKGITKNTRVIVCALHRYTVEVETLPMTIVGRLMPSVSLQLIVVRTTNSVYCCRRSCTSRD